MEQPGGPSRPIPRDATPGHGPLRHLHLSMDAFWRQAREQFLSQLSDRQRAQEEARREYTTLEDTVKSLSEAKSRAESAYGTKFQGKLVEFKLSRVLYRLDVLLRVGDYAIKFAPAAASPVWAAIRLIAWSITQDFETCQFLVDTVDQISEIVLLSEVYVKRQLRQLQAGPSELSLLGDKVLDKIPPMLTLVLVFSHVARRLLVDKGHFGRTFSITFGGAEPLKAMAKELETKRDDLDKMAGVAFSEALGEMLQDVRLDDHAIRKALSGLDLSNQHLQRAIEELELVNQDVGSTVKEIKAEQSREREAAGKRMLDEEFNAQLRWLCVDLNGTFMKYDPLRIDVRKTCTEKDVEAYVAASLRGINRFDQVKRRRATMEITKRSAGMFRYANLAVEALKSPAALRVPFKQLMENLPNGITDLYHQQLRGLEPEQLEMFLAVLRWVICGEGCIPLALIADELEGRYLQDGHDGEGLWEASSGNQDVLHGDEDGRGPVDWVEKTASCGPQEIVSVCATSDTWTKRSQSMIHGHDSTKGREVPRYELTHWQYHVTAAENHWAEEERGSDEWRTVYGEIDKFLTTRRFSKPGKEGYYDLESSRTSIFPSTPPLNTEPFIIGHAAVNLLVEHGSDVNSRAWKGRSDGETPLWYLVNAGGPAALVESLLNHGADASVADEQGWTVLHEAIRAGNVEITRTILNHPSVSIAKMGSDKPLLSCVLGSPSMSEAIIKLLVAKGCDANSLGASRCTPRYRAAEMNDVVMARFFLESGAARANEAVDVEGRKALHEAIIQGSLDMVNLLIYHGAAALHEDKGLRNALCLVADAGAVETLAAVLRAIKGKSNLTSLLTKPDQDGNTLLHRCAANGSADIARLHLETGGGNPALTLRNREGNTPHGAAAGTPYEQRDSVVELSTQQWCALNVSNVELRRQTVEFHLRRGSPVPQLLQHRMLSLATQFASADVYQRLVELDDQIDWITDRHGWSRLMLALQNRQDDVVKILQPFGQTSLAADVTP
ncbi:hypothetical protein N658DRAFT_505110 [Parathielavia hyrcaniae]|uniref:Uncharacterized protein n=1 Tax=Parathielavia hyrcaniae TaxID=113614 RepID=A0AAN6T3G1_9PEZI|nr:hypothetical protein N658DRAFT_505110 [Parathielavia hyrcaniae]